MKPEIKDLSKRLAALNPDELSLLAMRLKEQAVSRKRITPYERKPGHLPLSYAQQRLWFLDQLESGSPVYNIALAMRLIGRLNLAALERTFDELVRRHDILRTTFPAQDGQPVQVISPTNRTPLLTKDLRGLPKEEREAEAHRIVTEEAQKPFDLALGPLLRISLLRLEEEEEIVQITIHHIISDGWSMKVIVDEVAALYEAFTSGRQSPLSELPIQYGDFTLWQRDWLESGVMEKQLSYWRRQLSGSLPTLSLPSDRPRPQLRTYDGATQSICLPGILSHSLKALSRREEVTLFMSLLAAYQTLLHRYTSQDDIIVGADIANRNIAGVEVLIGFFVNMLVMRADFSGDPTFPELLAKVREVALGAYANQDIPFEKLVEELQPERNSSHTPLFQTAFVLQNVPIGSLNLTGLTLVPMEIGQGKTPFDLVLSMAEQDEDLTASLTYSTEMFDSTTIARMLRHFEILLSALVADPLRRLSELSLLTEAERSELLVQWNDSKAEYPKDVCVHQLFEVWSERSPQATALVFDDQQLSYGELNRRANQLASYLRSLGVGPEVLVGVCVEPSVEMVVGLLGILKAGAAYVPLDPTYPLERLALIIEDIQAPILLTQERLAERLPALWAQIIRLDSDWDLMAREREENIFSGAGSNNLAYINYTSGSTGKPKGIGILHRAVNRLVFNTNYIKLGPDDIVTQASNFSFDAATFEIWGALLHGGKLVGVRREVALSPPDFASQLREQGISTLFLTTALFNQVIKEIPTAFGSLRSLLFGGEAVDPRWVWDALENGPPERLLHVYGPTESTTFASWHLVREASKNNTTIPIGKPVSNTQIFILGRCMQLVPTGIQGELYLGGDGLARGYFNQPQQTAERFIPNPFSEEPGSRLYRTGDLARHLSDGSIEFSGRADNQVKIRGFRVEPGEIESALCNHPEVSKVVILAPQDEQGNRLLVAYVVPNHASAPTAGELRLYLRDRLPEYMLPSSFVMLDRLPLTPNGKVDRAALTVSAASRPSREEKFVAPCTHQEKILAEIWAQTLGLERVGRYDNFFELGGDSIRSIQVRAGAQKAGLRFSLQQLFRCQTIYQLAKELEIAAPEFPAASQTAPFSLISSEDRLRMPDGVEDAYPLAMLQEGMLFHSRRDPEGAIYRDIFSYHLRGPLDLEALRAAIEQILARHPALRASIHLSGFSQPLQLIHRKIDVPIKIEDLSLLSPVEQDRMMAEVMEGEKSRTLDWTQPPLIYFQVFVRSQQTFQLILTLHHAILDGWSYSTMLTELFKIYFSLLGEDVEISGPPTITYRDFIALEQEALQSDECRNFWTEKLKGCVSTVLPRPPYLDRAQGGPQSSMEEVYISTETSEGLDRLAGSLGVPLKTVLLAAHMKVMSLLSGQVDVLTGLVSNGRPETADGERVLGLFLNSLPFRLRLRHCAWEELVRQVFEAEQELLPFRRYPMGQLQRIMGGEPLFETAFNFIHFHVLRGLEKFEKLQLLEMNNSARTSFTFIANFNIDPASRGIRLGLDCDLTKLCAEQVKTFARYYERTLATMAQEPNQYFRFQSILSAQEQLQMLEEWNETAVDYPPDRRIHELFEAQVERTPEAIALVFENHRLTYRELNRRANKLAHYLQKLGVGPEVFVGICLGRSVEMIVGLLATLKAGGAYIPLDPAYPQERLRFILEDAQALALLLEEQEQGDGGNRAWSPGAHHRVSQPAALRDLQRGLPEYKLESGRRRER